MASGTCPWWVGKTKDELIDEVERLRVQRDLARDRAKVAEEDAHKYIKAEARTNIKLGDALRRIEELENRNVVLTDLNRELFNMGHIITDAQIDAAWAFANAQHHELTKVAALRALAKFGIERCEGCGGSGVTSPTHELDAEDCVYCDGHGWVIKERKDNARD